MIPEFSVKAWFGIASILVGILGYLPYFIGLYRKRLRPHVFSWFLWGFLMSIIWIGQIESNAGPGAWITGMSALVCLAIAAAAYRIGDKDITQSDWFCFIAGLLGIPLWFFTKDPLYSILFLTLIDSIAFVPTLRKLWLKPNGESALSYSITMTKFMVSFFAIKEHNLATSVYPAVMIIMNIVLVSTILWRRKTLRDKVTLPVN